MPERAWIDYTNYRGQRGWREIEPVRIWYGATEQHPEPGWRLQARAVDRGGAVRDFEMAAILGWRDSAPEA